MNTQQEWDNMLSFWFARDPKEWFYPPKDFDAEIRTKYQDLIAQARTGALDQWVSDPKGALCLVLLLDQFPRNIFRGSGDSFSSDNHALKLATRAVAQQFDKQLGQISTMHQSILYMPFLHAEDLLAQVTGVALYEVLLNSCQEGSKEQEAMAQSVEFSRRHLNCIAKLGRFPKRNEALGRPNTEEEDQYLKENPAGF